MTEQEIEAIKLRNELRKSRKTQASPGPWHVRDLDDDHSMSMITVVSGEGAVDRPDKEITSDTIVAATLVQYPRYVDSADQRWDENAQFIANARNDDVEADIDTLIAEIERLRNRSC